MLYVLNTNLNSKKKLFVALTEIYGLGKHNSYQICDSLGISVDRRLKQLSGSQLEHLTQLINQNYNIGSEVKRDTIKTIKRLIKIASYRGFRHSQGLPARGQRTHGNSRTIRRLKNSTILNK
uniref:Small ribosomal subunit protein uS13m n=1 Tax=Micractinium conductrix TaxID=554055 RepID=A0A2I4S766_9CHLO|nr:ribosomal protein S13 [Micractinium conductrix]